MTLFYQKEGSRQVHNVDVAHNEKLAELMARVAGELGEALLVFEEGCDGELTEEAFVVVLREKRHPKLHFHRQRAVHAEVHFNGRVVSRHASPAMTVDALKKRADRELGIDPAHAAEHVLQLSGTSERPAGSTHLGTLSHGHDHRVSFDLVPNERFQG